MSIQGAIEVDADAAVPAKIARRVAEILQHEQVGHSFPGVPLHRVRIEAVLPAGLALSAAHSNWLPEALPQIKTLPPFPASSRTWPIRTRAAWKFPWRRTDPRSRCAATCTNERMLYS